MIQNALKIINEDLIDVMFIKLILLFVLGGILTTFALLLSLFLNINFDLFL